MVTFDSEKSFKKHVKNQLKNMGFEVVDEDKDEIRFHRGRVDIHARKDGREYFMEAKWGPQNIRGDIEKCRDLREYPEVDYVYAVAPTMYLTQEIQDLAREYYVNLCGVLCNGEGKLVTLVDMGRNPSAQLSVSSMGVDQHEPLRPGTRFTWHVTVHNPGSRRVENVRVTVRSSKGFRPLSRKRTQKLGRIRPKENKTASFKLQVCHGCRPDEYRMFYRIRGDNIEPFEEPHRIAIAS